MRAVSLFRFVLQIPLFHALCTLPTQGLLCYNTDQLVSQQSRVCFISLCGLRLTGQISGLIEETQTYSCCNMFHTDEVSPYLSPGWMINECPYDFGCGWIKNFCPLLFCPVARSKRRPPPPLLFNGVLSATLFPCLWRLPQRNFPCRASSPQRGLMGSHEQGAACQTLALLPHD